ncbi:D-tyrosyl-tRNA(Tyr) deacylase [bacterium]|nr:D-tyrosyl-tRNA(Tyr) deacylase [bacterium]
MLAVVQRVCEGSVTIERECVGRIGPGLVVLLGIARDDTTEQAAWLADKLVNLRIFNDTDNKMNRSLLDVSGEMLIVSQFTLHGDCRKGRRPSFVKAAEPGRAIPLYHYFIESVQAHGVTTAEGVFGAMMAVALVNDGPVTLIVESP